MNCDRNAKSALLSQFFVSLGGKAQESRYFELNCNGSGI